MKEHHPGVKNDCCHVCENKFWQLAMVKRHLLDHAGQCVKAYEICREIGKKYDLLVLHMKSVHWTHLVDPFSEDEVLWLSHV